MSNKSVQRANRKYAKPGTCNQTGNTAPRFHWPEAIRVLIHRIAHYLDYTDDQMCRLKTWPSTNDLYQKFIQTVPWFPAYYDSVQVSAAERKEYEGPLHLFSSGYGPQKVHNRLRYLFETPGKSGGKRRAYGISVEHPDNPKGNRRETDVRYSGEIMRRLKMGQQITKDEIEEWSSENL